MTIILFLVYLLVILLFLLLLLLPFAFTVVAIILSIRHRHGLIKSFEIIASRLLAWERRIWYNSSEINKEKK